MKTRTYLPGAFILLAAGLFSIPKPVAAQTNGFVLQCLSARAAGQGCITRAREGLPTNMFRDPASIAWFDRPAFEINAAAFTPSLTFRNPSNPDGSAGALHSYPLGSVAYIGSKPFRGFSWGFGLEPIGGFGADFKLKNPTLGPDQDYESFFAALKAGPAFAYEPVPGLSVGAAMQLVYSQIHKFRMPFSMSPQDAAGFGALAQLDSHYPALFSNFSELTAYGDSRDFSGWGWGTSLGIAWRSEQGTIISASWTPRVDLKLDGGSATIDMNRQFGMMFDALVQERVANHGESEAAAQASVAGMLASAGLDMTLGAAASYDAATEMAIPQTVGLGFSFTPASRWNVALEGVWMDWSAAEAIMPFILTRGDNQNVNMLVNANPADADFTFPFPLHWEDSWTGKVGLDFALDATTALRAGYLYGSNPVPDNTVFIAFPAISTQAVTAGAGFRLGTVPFEVSVVHAIQMRLNGNARGHMIASEYINSSTTMRQTTVTFGAVWPF